MRAVAATLKPNDFEFRRFLKAVSLISIIFDTKNFKNFQNIDGFFLEISKIGDFLEFTLNEKCPRFLAKIWLTIPH